MKKSELEELELIADMMEHFVTDGDTIYSTRSGLNGIPLIKVVAEFNQISRMVKKLVRRAKNEQKKGT